MNNIHKILFFILVISIQFHFIIINYFPLYRDVISGFYFLLVFIDLIKGKNFILKLDFLTSYLVFVFFVTFLWFFDTNYRLYGSDISIETATSNVSENLVGTYILRNVVLYLPIIFYYYVNKGSLKFRFITMVFFIFLFLLPFSMYFYTESVFQVPLNFDSFLLFGQQFIPFNTYVPFLAFPFILSLSFFFKTSCWSYRIFYLLLIFLIFFYSFISSSRQSIIFIFIVLFYMFIIKYKFYSLLFFGFIIFFSVFFSGLILENLEINRNVIDKFLNGEEKILNSSRWDKISYGFSLLKPFEYFVGAGLSSVPDGGPHNDFVRWIQRTGLVVGIYSFFPFFLLFLNLIRIKRNENPFLFDLIFCSILFIFYTSLFGYPREDVWQAFFVFLGPIIYYGSEIKFKF